MKMREYVLAVNAAQSKITLNKIIYYSGFDAELNESEVRAIIELANYRLTEMKRKHHAELARLNARDIKRIQA